MTLIPKENTKLYQLWQNYGCEGWNYTGFDTLHEAITETRYGHDWFITRRIDFEIIDKEIT